MLDASAVVERIISEHHAIRENIKLAGDSVNDIEALFTLQRTQAGWSHTSVTALAGGRDRLLRAISTLEEGLKNHFGFEEEALPSLFGELLMKALLQEHRGISRLIAGARATLTGIQLEKLDQRELLSRKSEIQHNTESLLKTIEEHAQHEEVILNMLAKSLKESTE